MNLLAYLWGGEGAVVSTCMQPHRRRLLNLLAFLMKEAIHGDPWSSMEMRCIGNPWQSMVTNGNVWQPKANYGNL